mgnify:CR=1 FL=1
MNAETIRHIRMRLGWFRAAWLTRHPGIFVIESTNRCNLSCRMCPMHGVGDASILRREQGDMDPDRHRDLIDRIARVCPEAVIILHGAGEPLLHPAFDALIQNVRRHPGLTIAFLTNAVLLGEDWSERLLAHRIETIGFSVNGVDPDSYHALTGKDRWREVMENIDGFLERLRRHPRVRIRTQMQIVDTPLIRDRIEAFVRHWAGRVDEVVVQVERDATGRGLSIDSVADPLARRPIRRSPCHRLAEPLTIAWNGDVHLCCEVWHGEKRLGNVFEEPLDSVLSRQREVVRLHRTFRADAIGVCRGCLAREETRMAVRRRGEWIETRSPVWRRYRRLG